jgi:hypothetical protein
MLGRIVPALLFVVAMRDAREMLWHQIMLFRGRRLEHAGPEHRAKQSVDTSQEDLKDSPMVDWTDCSKRQLLRKLQGLDRFVLFAKIRFNAFDHVWLEPVQSQLPAAQKEGSRPTSTASRVCRTPIRCRHARHSSLVIITLMSHQNWNN